MRSEAERLLTVSLLAAGALLATVANVLHPYIPPQASTEEFLAVAGGTAGWLWIHVGVAVAAVLLVGGIALVGRRLEETAGAAAARVAAVFAVLGGGIFAVQIGGLDGVALPVLAEQVAAAPDEPALLAVAEAVRGLDVAMLALSVGVFLGATYLMLGVALRQARLYPAWIATVSIGGGAAGVLVGTAMLLGVGDAVTFVAFRIVALLVTVATVGLVFAMAREPLATGHLTDAHVRTALPPASV